MLDHNNLHAVECTLFKIEFPALIHCTRTLVDSSNEFDKLSALLQRSKNMSNTLGSRFAAAFAEKHIEAGKSGQAAVFQHLEKMALFHQGLAGDVTITRQHPCELRAYQFNSARVFDLDSNSNDFMRAEVMRSDDWHFAQKMGASLMDLSCEGIAFSKGEQRYLSVPLSKSTANKLLRSDSAMFGAINDDYWLSSSDFAIDHKINAENLTLPALDSIGLI